MNQLSNIITIRRSDSNKIANPIECDKLAVSIIDRIYIPINKQAEKNDEFRMFGDISFVMGIGVKDIMKKELYQNPDNFINECTPDDIKTDIIRFSKCMKNYLNEW